MKLLLQVVTSAIITFSYTSCYSQQSTLDTYEVSSFKLQIEKHHLTKLTDGCENFLNQISLIDGGKQVFTETICTAEVDDLGFSKKGYITIIEHYSSPVGWSQYYIFDLCKEQLLITKRLDEGTELDFEKFIEPREAGMLKFVEKTISFN